MEARWRFTWEVETRRQLREEPAGKGEYRLMDAGKYLLRPRRLVVDTHQELVVYMRGDCHVCRSEEFNAHSRIQVNSSGRNILATPQCGGAGGPLSAGPPSHAPALVGGDSQGSGCRRYIVGATLPALYASGQALPQRRGCNVAIFRETAVPLFTALVTVDPHLHRYHDLAEIYDIPARVGHAAPLIAEWIAANVDKPVLIGPDSESEQWVSAVAKQAGAPFTVLNKTRGGDRDVEVSVPHIERWLDHTPVLVDDIISNGHTMLETLSHLKRLGLSDSVCLAVHGIFAESSGEKLATTTPRLVTSNTIHHPSTAGVLAASIRELD